MMLFGNAVEVTVCVNAAYDLTTSRKITAQARATVAAPPSTVRSMGQTF
jgi:hypothetical protein